MKKLSKKVLAIILAIMMVATSAPFAAMAATDAPSAKLTALSDAVDAYRAKMNGQKVYTNMSAAYTSYINAVTVFAKAKYGANNVTESDITNATNDLTTKTNAMAEWTSKTGTAKPTASAPGFSSDGTNLSSVTNCSNELDAGNWPTGLLSGTEFHNTGNSYLTDAYNWGYQNLAYVQTGVSSANAVASYSSTAPYTSQSSDGGFKPSSDNRSTSICLYIPNTVILYDGSNGFKGRIGVMARFKIGQNYERRLCILKVDGNDYFHFGNNWGVARKNATGCNGDADAQTDIAAKYTERYDDLDFISGVVSASHTDIASGTDQAVSHGSRSVKNSTIYLANYLEFTMPSAPSGFDPATDNSYQITSLPVYSLSGGVENDAVSQSNHAKASMRVNISVLNYSRLITAINSAKQSLRITAENPHLEVNGGMPALISAIEAAENWNPNGQSNITTLVNNMTTYINNINSAVNALSDDDQPYGQLCIKMDDVLSVKGTLGDWYNVNHDTDAYSQSSVDTFVTAFTYAQYIFDNNTNFADSYSFPAKTVTVGSGDTAKTVNVPAATKTVQQVYEMLMGAVLEVSDRVNVETLVLYIEELKVALANADVYGIAGSTTEENMENAVENAKYRIWGETTLTDPETGETYTVSNYGNPAKLKKNTTANQNAVTTQENNLRPYIEGLVINQNKVVTYNDVTGKQNSLGRIKQDMADTNLYPRGDYINGDTLDEAINYVNNNFIPQVIPNANTQIVAGIVAAKIAEYKNYIQYCQDVIDALQKTFLALDNGTIIETGDMEELVTNPIEDKWQIKFNRYNNVVVFRTTKAKSTLNLGAASLKFWQGDTVAWAADNEYRSVIDSISINDTAGASASIRKENAISTSELPSVELSAEQCAQYPGCLTMSTSNGGTYGVTNFEGVWTKAGAAYGKAGSDGSYTSGLAVTDGTQGAASGMYTYDQTASIMSGNAYLDLPAESSVTLTRTTTPKQTSYTNTGYFGAVFYWICDGAGLSAIKNVYNGYYHERTSNTYTQTTTVVDISNLKELVATMNTLNKLDYTEASWNNMKTKLAAATSNDFGSGKTYREITTASLTSQLTTRYQNLYDAWKGLIPAATNIELTRPVAQAQNENKDIGAVVRANDNVWYTKYNTNNDVTAENTYGTYTTNTWNEFKNAYEAGDVAIFGDGTNPGIYATPVLDNDGNTVVVGARGFARFINGDGDPVDLGDLESYGLTINDMDAVSQVSGVSLSTEQAAINTLAANIKTKYNALKRWATFTPVDSAVDALNDAFDANCDKKYTTASLQALNSAFAQLTTSYYTIANDAAAQHELNRSGQAIYTEDNNDAIASEAARINAAVSALVVSSLDQDYYTAESIIAMAENAASDPDAYDASQAIDEATTLSGQLYTTVNIAPLNNKAVIGVNYVDSATLDAQLATIMTHVNAVTYDVTVKNEAGQTLATYEDQPYGTQLSISSTSGNPVEWTYTYESRTVKNHVPTRTGTMATFDFVVVGDTTITEGNFAYGEGTAATGFKVIFNDNLNHVYNVEYVPANTVIAYSGNTVVINYPNGTSKEVDAPNYAFYNLTGYKDNASITVTRDEVVTAMYEADAEAETFTLDIYIYRDGFKKSTATVKFNDKLEFNETDLRQVGTGRTAKKGFYYISGTKTDLASAANSLPNNTGTVYAYTIVQGDDYNSDWISMRTGGETIGQETPASIGTDFTYFIDKDTAIVVYPTQETYESAVQDGYINTAAHAKVRSDLILSNSKFQMHGTFYLPDNNVIVECGMLMYLGNQTIEADDLTLATYSSLGAYRLKYTKSTQYNNINVSVNRAALAGKTLNVRYRTYVIYKVGNNTQTIYSDLASDTQQF